MFSQSKLWLMASILIVLPLKTRVSSFSELIHYSNMIASGGLIAYVLYKKVQYWRHPIHVFIDHKERIPLDVIANQANPGKKRILQAYNDQLRHDPHELEQQQKAIYERF